ncbi:MAG: hypothetical protein MPK06_06715 [Alphaproteobacteria bacterium]|nr:hypothetical protein [Alphaproteobacteria bacterium]MDA7983262.1 hypothetical protein [Alphaproteobacteria bacterium]MDA7987410.1 hypothetical protein [Alphaproteobacteria bacterium]MDA7988957.1 hypothetical protein [Alphaproteobacteria bacterium]MDA8001573.1 hypothetical protein [Alphaproteobacteria bacterium]
MATNGLHAWAVDLAEIGAIYPFQGMEFILYLAGLAFWVFWHVRQLRHETEELGKELGG